MQYNFINVLGTMKEKEEEQEKVEKQEQPKTHGGETVEEEEREVKLKEKKVIIIKCSEYSIYYSKHTYLSKCIHIQRCT